MNETMKHVARNRINKHIRRAMIDALMQGAQAAVEVADDMMDESILSRVYTLPVTAQGMANRSVAAQAVFVEALVEQLDTYLRDYVR